MYAAPAVEPYATECGRQRPASKEIVMSHRWLPCSLFLLLVTSAFTSCAGPAPLMLAARQGDSQKVIAQIDAGANPNMRGSDGVTPLMYAAGHGNVDMTAASRNELTYRDLQHSGDNTETVKALLSHGAEVSLVDVNGQTALWYAAYHGNVEAMALLMRAGGAPDKANNYKQTPLAMSAREGHEACVALLLTHHVDLDSRSNPDQKTPLIMSSYTGAEGCVRLLLEAGANVELVDINGHGALQNAVFKGHLAVIKLLLLNGAPVNTRDKGGNTPLATAISRGYDTGYDSIAAVLKAAGGVK
jgi:ankyrin repeat protein